MTRTRPAAGIRGPSPRELIEPAWIALAAIDPTRALRGLGTKPPFHFAHPRSPGVPNREAGPEGIGTASGPVSPTPWHQLPM